MALKYLDFDYSEDAQGWATLDAMASGIGPQVAAIHAEIVEVLTWAHAAFGGQRGPLDDGGTWDFNLQSQQDYTAYETLDFDERSSCLNSHAIATSAPRHTMTLSLAARPEFVAALRAHFDLN
jgi:hypothetical protein